MNNFIHQVAVDGEGFMLLGIATAEVSLSASIDLHGAADSSMTVWMSEIFPAIRAQKLPVP
jgi:hypothetical protein